MSIMADWGSMFDQVSEMIGDRELTEVEKFLIFETLLNSNMAGEWDYFEPKTLELFKKAGYDENE